MWSLWSLELLKCHHSNFQGPLFAWLVCFVLFFSMSNFTKELWEVCEFNLHNNLSCTDNKFIVWFLAIWYIFMRVIETYWFSFCTLSIELKKACCLLFWFFSTVRSKGFRTLVFCMPSTSVLLASAWSSIAVPSLL